MLRVAFYSHDTYGLGHFRRCLKLAAALAARLPGVQGLLLTGSPWHSLFVAPPGFRVVPLPPVVKRGPGVYAPRDGSQELGPVLAERRRRILSAVTGFRPDLLVVDNVPCGLHGEVLPAVRGLKGGGGGAKAVLALRDILDRPEAVLGEWSRAGAEEAIEGLFDEVWVFGSGADAGRLVAEGLLGSAPGKVHPCGWLEVVPAPGPGGSRPGPLPAPRRPVVVVTGGGGGDAEPLVRTYLEALRAYRPGVISRVVLGPDFPARARRELEPAGEVGLRDFVPDLPRLLERCDVVVAMAGYNTVCELLAIGRPAVLVPRVAPRQEQLLRARRWEGEGRAKVLHPGRLSPGGLWAAVEELLHGGRPLPLPAEGGRVAAARAAALLGARAVGG